MRAHIVIPADLVAEVDELVGARRRSRFVTEAVAEKVARLRLLRAAEEAVGSLADRDVAGWETSESTSAWVRELRSRDWERERRLRDLRAGNADVE